VERRLGRFFRIVEAKSAASREVEAKDGWRRCKMMQNGWLLSWVLNPKIGGKLPKWMVKNNGKPY